MTGKDIAALVVIAICIALGGYFAVGMYRQYVITRQDNIVKEAAYQHEIELLDQNAQKKILH